VLKDKVKRGMTASSLPLVHFANAACSRLAALVRLRVNERFVSLSYEAISAGKKIELKQME
jgi:hypothetical protein